ncbi:MULTISPECIES: amino acid ABC transporter ATP-binding protein [unclassified Haematobacter]|uniref:amino acid ABC transporter ATP-binding protein n=1 Tax=unclassified Haematobacter TaxID=2640585 RepID=UPI0025C61481|nr:MULTISPECIES: amino acid ABC transporter ATP-binding protein [unclassified Haematobacter]
MTAPAVTVRGLSKRFADTPVLDQISFNAPSGEVTCLIGPSGSGKSTLLRCIATLEEPSEGEITIVGHPTRQQGRNGKSLPLPAAQLRALRSHVGIVFQQFNLWPHMTALGNVSEALKTVRGVSRPLAEDIARAKLDAVGLCDRASYYPAQLSGGQQQRVAIARALALEPKLLLFDEPTSSLDPELTGEVLNVMRKLAQDGMSMIVVSHEIGFVASVASKVIFLDRGRVILDGSPQEVFAKPRQERMTRFLDTYLDRDAMILA